MAASPAALSVLLMSSLFGGQSPSIDDCVMEACLSEVETMLSDLDVGFQDSVDKLFREPQSNGTEARCAISALMAECDAVLYAAEKRALNVTREVLIKHFVGKKKKPPRGTEEILLKNKNLIDLIRHSLTMGALEDAFEAISNRRREIFLLLKTYPNESDTKRLVQEFFDLITIKGYVLKDATKGMDESYKKYVADAAKTMTAAQKLMIRFTVLEFIEDAVYHDHIKSYTTNPTESDLLSRYVDKDLMEEIRSARRRAAGTLTNFTPDQIESVSETDLRAMHI